MGTAHTKTSEGSPHRPSPIQTPEVSETEDNTPAVEGAHSHSVVTADLASQTSSHIPTHEMASQETLPCPREKPDPVGGAHIVTQQKSPGSCEVKEISPSGHLPVASGVPSAPAQYFKPNPSHVPKPSQAPKANRNGPGSAKTAGTSKAQSIPSPTTRQARTRQVGRSAQPRRHRRY